jgi:hypothetical protein
VISNYVLYSSARSACQLTSCGGIAADDRRDFLEGHRKYVVQHERDALRRGEAVEHDQQR